MILDGRYKLVIDGESRKAGSVELFDLLRDSAEERNRAADKPKVTQRLTEELRRWQASVLASLGEADY